MFCSSTRTQLTQLPWCCQSRPLRKCCRTQSLRQPLQTQPLTHPLTHLSRPPSVWPPASLKHIQQLSHQVTSLLYLSCSMKMFCLLNSQYNIIELSHVYICVYIPTYLSTYLPTRPTYLPTYQPDQPTYQTEVRVLLTLYQFLCRRKKDWS